MGLNAVIAFGTERYPEKVARRLRAVNITAWLAAAGMALFAIKRPTDPDPFTIVTAFCVASTPLLHRFSPVAAPLALVCLGFVHATRLILTIGTGDGIFLLFLTSAPLSLLLLGVERYRLAAALSAAGVVLVIVLNFTVPHDTGDIPPLALKINFSLNFALNMMLVFAVVLYVARQAARAEVAAEREFERSEGLLRNILPTSIAEQLKDAPGDVIARRHDEVSVLFADMAGFTARAGSMSPDRLVRLLNGVFSEFDRLAEIHGVEKIKTSGDAYMAVSGAPVARPDHAEALAALALDMLETAPRLQDGVPIRIGLACGPVVAGVVGSKKFFYDVWGDAVNVAARMESTGVAGRIQVSPAFRERISGDFLFEPRGKIEVKGKGPMETWFLLGRKDAAAAQPVAE